MKTSFLKSMLLFATIFYSCGGGSDSPKANNENVLESEIFKLEKSPVEVVGKKVKIDITSSFPAGYTQKDEQVVLKPYLENKEGKTQYFKEVTYKEGEDFTSEGGGIREYTVEVDYDPEMNVSVLFMDVIIKQTANVKEAQLDEEGNPIETAEGSPTTEQEDGVEVRTEKVKLGEGIIITPLLVDLDYKPVFVGNSLLQGGSGVENSMFGFKKNSAQVRKEDLNSDKIKKIKEVLKQTRTSNIKISSIDIVGYASPEGPLKFNELLSITRAKAVRSQIQRMLKDAKVTSSEDMYLVRGEGPDWNGFFEMIQMSNIADKDLIRKTLQDEQLLDARSETLKRFIEAYPNIEREILSNLRRVELKIVYSSGAEKMGGEKELLVKLDKGISKMSYEDLLDVISYIDDDQKRISIAQEAVNKNPKDYKGYNNYGAALWLGNRKNDAVNNFMKAFELEKNEVTSVNLAVLKMDNNEYEEAGKLMENVSLPQSLYNKGILSFMMGNYSEALNFIGEKNIFNKSLATLLSGDVDKSLQILSTVQEYKPKQEYLKGVIYARQNNIDDLNASVAKFSSEDQVLSERYKTDIEFKILFEEKVEEEKVEEKKVEENTEDDEEVPSEGIELEDQEES